MSTYYNPEQGQRGTFRLNSYRLAVILVIGILIGRVYQLQLVEGQTYQDLADENRFDTVSVPAARGVIYDRYGVPLALNVPSFNVTVTPAALPDDEEAELEVLERLSALIGIPASGEVVSIDETGLPTRSLLSMVREGQGIAPYRPVNVATDIERETAQVILERRAELPGVDIEVASVREYPTGATTAHIVGYMGPVPEERVEQYRELDYDPAFDRIGYDGVEFSLEELLRGANGYTVVEQDVAGLQVGSVRQELPQPGFSVTLTIDSELQAAAEEALTNEIAFLNNYYNEVITERGVAIAMNPSTGEILAMVSWPTYDNSRFARAIDYPYYLQVAEDPLRPLFNQAVSSLYPPGSTFKIITATGALEDGIVTADQQIFDPGSIELSNRYYPNDPGSSQRFVCWIEKSTGAGHDYLNLVGAIANSCDVYFYKVGGGFDEEGIDGLGIDRLNYWMEQFGLGEFTGVELAGEIDGIRPDPTWKRRTYGENWSTGDTYNAAFGQGYITTTPLQMLNAMNALANGGTLYQPTLVREIIDAEGHVVRGFEPEAIRQIPASPENISIVQEGMRQAVLAETGTAIFADLPYTTVAGKTGTAEYCDDEAAALELCVPGNWPAHAWFMAYAPFHEPEIAAVAFLYNGGEGAIVAGPVVVDILEAYFRLKTERNIAAQVEAQEAQEAEGIQQPPVAPEQPSPVETSSP
jgi:penicillin-binding protein 2